MATRTATTSNPPRLRSKLFSWDALAATSSDVGSAVEVLGYSALLFSVRSGGTYAAGSGATLQLQGSHDGSYWFNLLAPIVTPVDTTTAVTASVLPRYVRPRIAGGTTTIINVDCLAR